MNFLKGCLREGRRNKHTSHKALTIFSQDNKENEDEKIGSQEARQALCGGDKDVTSLEIHVGDNAWQLIWNPEEPLWKEKIQNIHTRRGERD
jgi:hypothetical protein